MINTILTQLGTLVSKAFLVGSLLPVLLTVVVNAAILGWVYEPFARWVGSAWADTGKLDKLSGLLTVIVPTFVFAYALWSISPGLLASLESGLPPWRNYLRQRQYERFFALQQKIDDWRRRRRELDNRDKQWWGPLADAREKGLKKPNAYQPLAELEALRVKRQKGDFIDPKDLDPVNKHLLVELARHDATQPAPSGAYDLDRDHDDLLRLLRYARDYSQNEYLASLRERDVNFSAYRVQPTAMGNMAESVRGYALSRYGMGVEVFWTQLLTAMKADKTDPAAFEALTDQRGQLDFLVALFWLISLSTASWLLILPFVSWLPLPLLAVAVTGPGSAFVIHRLALMNYRTYADIQRSAIDLYRLKLLDRLQIPLPQTMDDERFVWRLLTQRFLYADAANIAFKKPTP